MSGKVMIGLLIFFVCVFIIGYAVTGLVVNAVMSDFKEPQGITIGAIVKCIEVKELPYTDTQNLQPAIDLRTVSNPKF